MSLRRAAPLLVLLLVVGSTLNAGTNSEAAFKKLQSLAGDWEGKDGHGMAAKTSFRVLASKTAVMETLSPSGMEEMITLYSLDQDGIALVHFCPTNNQPRMRVVLSSDDIKELSFDYQGAGNLKSPATSITSSSALKTKITSPRPGLGAKAIKTPPWSSTSPAKRGSLPVPGKQHFGGNPV